MGQCGAAVAEAVEVFGRIDILLCCTSEGMNESIHLLSKEIYIAPILTKIQLS